MHRRVGLFPKKSKPIFFCQRSSHRFENNLYHGHHGPSSEGVKLAGPQVAEGGGRVELAGPLVMEGVEVLVGVGVGPLGQEEVAVGLDRRG